MGRHQAKSTCMWEKKGRKTHQEKSTARSTLREPATSHHFNCFVAAPKSPAGSADKLLHGRGRGQREHAARRTERKREKSKRRKKGGGGGKKNSEEKRGKRTKKKTHHLCSRRASGGGSGFGRIRVHSLALAPLSVHRLGFISVVLLGEAQRGGKVVAGDAPVPCCGAVENGGTGRKRDGGDGSQWKETKNKTVPAAQVSGWAQAKKSRTVKEHRRQIPAAPNRNQRLQPHVCHAAPQRCNAYLFQGE